MHTEAGTIADPRPAPLAAAASYVREIWEYRHFWMSLVAADLRRRYRRSLLGVGWSLLQPILITAALTLVYSRLLNMSFREFGPMLLTGFAVWNYVHGVTLQGCGSLLSAEQYIRQQSIPMAIFPLRTVLMLGFHFLISLALSLGFAWAVNGFANVPALWSLIPTLFLLFVFGWAVAILTGFVHVYFPDTQHFAEVFLQMLFFLTPIMYPPRLLEENGLAQMTRFNPVARLVTLVRLPMLEGQVPTLFQFSLAAAMVGCVALLAVVVLWRCERRLVFAL
jgi:lipopolysaccharide transport system permease protein